MNSLFHISERTHSGLILMTCLTEHHANKQPMTLKEIAARMKLSSGYLEEVAAALRAAGLISGRTGPRGGYTLTRAPKSITTEDVITALEGPIALVGCQTDGETCPLAGGCSSERLWGALQSKIVASLRETTLADIAK